MIFVSYFITKFHFHLQYKYKPLVTCFNFIVIGKYKGNNVLLMIQCILNFNEIKEKNKIYNNLFKLLNIFKDKTK
jgi:hypothetical protein